MIVFESAIVANCEALLWCTAASIAPQVAKRTLCASLHLCSTLLSISERLQAREVGLLLPISSAVGVSPCDESSLNKRGWFLGLQHMQSCRDVATLMPSGPRTDTHL